MMSDESQRPGVSAGRSSTGAAASGSASSPAPGSASARPRAKHTAPSRPSDPFIRAENEDDDGYDPYSDRRPEPEPLFEPDPWA